MEVDQVISSEPSETAFPVTDMMERADAKGAARARIALGKKGGKRGNELVCENANQSLNMVNIFGVVLRWVACAFRGRGRGGVRGWNEKNWLLDT